MRKRIKIVIGSIAVVAIVVVSTVGIVRVQFERRINADIDAVLATSAAAESVIATEEDVAVLPKPVQRWLHWSGVVGKPIPTTVRLRQEGELRVGDFGWLPFTAEQYYSTQPPAFLWTTNVRMAPGVSVVGQDRYVDGRGFLEMRVLGAIPVARDEGADMDEGDLLRYLNETMWFPAGVLSPHISWEAIDTTSARATMEYGGSRGSAVFFFDEQGRPTNMTADRFDREYGGVVPWSTPITAYGEFHGIRIPTEGEGVYARPDGDFSYIRLTIIEVDYDHAERF